MSNDVTEFVFNSEDDNKYRWHCQQCLQLRTLPVGNGIALHPMADELMLREIVKSPNFGLRSMSLFVERVADFNGEGQKVLIKRFEDGTPIDALYKIKAMSVKASSSSSNKTSDTHQDRDLKMALNDYLNSSFNKVKGYDSRITETAKTRNEMQYGYIQRRLAPKASFKNTNVGSIRAAIERAISYGYLTALPNHERKGMFQINSEFLK